MQKKILCVLFSLFLSMMVHAQVRLGIDVLADHNFELLKGKRVGLITNQTGVNSDGVRTRVILKKKVNLVALFSPEHGLDGTEPAGKYVATRKDSVTGLVAHSLYGPTRKPTPGMLKGIDTLVFDMQDIGCRSYTYVSTMIKCMEAAGELGIDFVVLDRPNPLGGLRVEGPSIEQRWLSFIGIVPVPYVHGMTVGEIARMANGAGWIKPRCNLLVVRMQGWKRTMDWADTGLEWVKPSPNIPRYDSPYYYVVTGLIGELAGLDIGCGSPAAFEIISAKWLDPDKFTATLGRLDTPGVRFTPWSNGTFHGSRLKIDRHANTDLCELAVHLIEHVNRPASPSIFARSKAEKLDLFFKSYGSTSIRSAIESGASTSKIVKSWEGGLAQFRQARTPFLLY